MKRLARGDNGINPLDDACKLHDIAYTSKDPEDRYLADKRLQKTALKRILTKDASLGERATAVGVALAMKAKKVFTRRGKGLKKKKLKPKRVTFNTLIKHARAAIKKVKPTDVEAAVHVAIDAVKRSKHGKHVKQPRIIKVPTHSGGVLPLIPMFSGLSALGAIASGAPAIINAINQYVSAKKQLDEHKRHNREMEAIAIGSGADGKGLYLHVNKTGSGLYLAPKAKNQ